MFSIDTVAVIPIVFHVVRLIRELSLWAEYSTPYLVMLRFTFRDIPFRPLARHIGQDCKGMVYASSQVST